jgi:hypothetical protein
MIGMASKHVSDRLSTLIFHTRPSQEQSTYPPQSVWREGKCETGMHSFEAPPVLTRQAHFAIRPYKRRTCASESSRAYNVPM